MPHSTRPLVKNMYEICKNCAGGYPSVTLISVLRAGRVKAPPNDTTRLLACIALVLSTLPLLGHSTSGALRLNVTDPGGLPFKAEAELSTARSPFPRPY